MRLATSAMASERPDGESTWTILLGAIAASSWLAIVDIWSMIVDFNSYLT